jgi:uncharacterized protein
MKIRSLEKLIIHCSYGFDAVHFCWHGGEPLLMGLDFYKEVVRVQNIITSRDNVKFSNVIQTNGVLISEEWISFFKENQFGVGFSIDLPLDVHRIHRNDSLQEVQYVLGMLKNMKSKGMSVNVLCVISKLNVLRGKEIFGLLSDLGIDTFSLLPLKGVPLPNCPKEPTNEELSTLFITLFDLWAYKENLVHRIEPIASMVESLAGRSPQLCSFSSSCLKRMITITQDGYVTPCTSLVQNEYILGNVFSQKLLDILGNEKTAQLRKQRTAGINQECFDCDFISICRGGCRADAFWSTKQYDGRYPYCVARKNTFSHIREQLNKIV